MADASLSFRLLGSDVSASKALRGVGDTAKSVGEKLGGVGQAIKTGLSFAVAEKGMDALTETFRTGWDELKDGEAGLAQLKAGLQSTGGVAGISADQMENLATSIQGYSGQTDDSIVKTEQLLLTFTNIRDGAGKNNDIFTQTTKAAADMAAKMGGDASESAVRLGKALNDPIKGVTALSKVGVSFDDAQKKQIASMVKAGDTMGAQKVILGELNKEFGGAAKAAGESLPGQMARAKRSFEDMAQNLVSAFLPIFLGVMHVGQNLAAFVFPAVGKAVTALTGLFQPIIGAFQSGQVHGSGLERVLTTIGSAARTLWLGLQAFFAAMSDGDVTSDGFVGKLETAGAAIHDMLPKLQAVAEYVIGKVLPFFKQLATFFTDYVLPAASNLAQAALPLLKGAFEIVAGAVKFVIDHLHDIGDLLNNVVGPALVAVTGFIKDLSGFLVAHKDALVAVGIAVGTVVGGIKAYQGVMQAQKAVMQLYSEWTYGMTGAQRAFAAAQSGVVNGMKAVKVAFATNPFGMILLILAAVVGAFIYAYTHSEKFRSIVQGALKGVENAAKWMWNNAIKPVFNAFAEAAKVLWTVLKVVFAAIVIAILLPFAPIILLWTKCAWFRDGVKELAKLVVGFFVGLGKGIWDVLKFIGGIIADCWGVFEKFATVVWGVVKKVATFLWDYLYKPIFELIGKVIGVFWDFLKFLGGLAGKVFDALVDVAKWIMKPFADAGKWLVGIGGDLIKGLINGLKAGASWLLDAIVSIIPGPIKGIVKSALGIKSPSTVFHGYGQNIVQGMVNGLRASGGLLTDHMKGMTATIKSHGQQAVTAAHAAFGAAALALPGGGTAAGLAGTVAVKGAAAGALAGRSAAAAAGRGAVTTHTTEVHVHVTGAVVGDQRSLGKAVAGALSDYKASTGGRALGLG